MAINTRASGTETNQTVKALSGIKMAIYISDIGSMERLMDMESTQPPMAPLIKAAGLTMSKKEMEKRRGLINRISKESIKREPSMEKVNTDTQTAPFTRVIGVTIRFLATGLTRGQMERATKVNGLTIICTVTEPFHGPMEGDTKATTSMIRSMALAFTPGKTTDSTPVSGRMGSSTGKAFTKT